MAFEMRTEKLIPAVVMATVLFVAACGDDDPEPLRIYTSVTQATVDAVVCDLAASAFPLCGIVHAAVAYHDALLGDMTNEKVDDVLAPKLTGAVNLTNAVLAHDFRLEFFVSFSSMAQVVGWPGQSNYVAANAGKDDTPHQFNYNHPDWHPFYLREDSRDEDLHTLQSVTKSVASTMIGVAIRQGAIEGTDVPALGFFAEREFAEGSWGWLRAQDIRDAAEQEIAMLSR